MKVKVILENDIRRWRYNASQSKLSSLREFVATSFALTDFWLQYEDDEGDRLTLSSETDFEDAFTCAHEQDRKSLKIYVIHGSAASSQRVQADENNNNAHSPPNGGCSSDTKKCFEIKAAAIDFLSNPEIVKLLPDLHRRIFEEIKKGKQEAETTEAKSSEDGDGADDTTPQWDSPESIEKIIRDILSTEDKFQPIVEHTLYSSKLDSMIPHIARKISAHLPFLMNFSCEAIAAWIPHLASVLGHGFNTFNSFDTDMPSAMSTFFPLMCSFMSQHGDYSGLAGFCDADDRDSNGDVIHYNVQCDSCLTSPIKGARFKCVKCRNFDLCGQCESFGKHDPNHPMIKFNHSARNVGAPPFDGLHEIMRLFGPSAFPPPPHGHAPPHHPPHAPWFGAGHHGWRRRGGAQRWCQQQQQQQHSEDTSSQQGGWCNQDRGHRAWRKWNRWQQQQQQQPHQQQQGGNPWEMHHWQQWCNNRHNNMNDNASVISSTLSSKASDGGKHGQQQQPKKIKVMADFVKDVTLPDRTYYPTDTVLTKTWKMKNNGEHEWGDNVELVFFKGNESLTLEKRYPVVSAKPGQEVEVSAVIKTPDKPGRYCSYYRLQRNGEYFGPRVWVDIFAVDEENTAELNKQAENNGGGKAKKGAKGKKKEEKQLKKQMKLDAKQMKLEAKQSKLEAKMNDVSQQLDAQNENESSKRLAKRQEKLQKAQDRIQHKVQKLRRKSDEIQHVHAMNNNNEDEDESKSTNANMDEAQFLDAIANAAVQDIERNMAANSPSAPSAVHKAGNNELDEIPAISCVCGATLHKTTPVRAYNNYSVRVNCDICGKFCAPEKTIYHCPNAKSMAHPQGYDLCSSCAEYQMQGFIPQQPLVHQQPVNMYPSPMEPQPPQQPQPAFVPAMQPPIMPQVPMQPPVMNMNMAPDVVAEPPQEQETPFVYQQQLETLRAMGFDDEEKLKAELIQQKGNVQTVANRLLQN